MWDFKAEQKTFEIGKFSVGGIPGERAAALIGTIFYQGHRVITDADAGTFDRPAAEGLIKAQEEFSEKTGNPHIVDVVISKPEYAGRVLDFATSATDAPIAIDGTTSEIRLAALDYIVEHGVKGDFIYNSLTPEAKPAEFEGITKTGVKAAFLLALNTRDFTTEGRVKAVQDVTPKALNAGIKSILVDTSVMDLPTLGQACMAIHRVKDETGLPAGCGSHNAVSLWRGLKSKMGDQAVNVCAASSVAMSVTVGADFVFYGPIEGAKYVFPVTAMVDVAQSQIAVEKKVRLSREHPRFRVG